MDSVVRKIGSHGRNMLGEVYVVDELSRATLEKVARDQLRDWLLPLTAKA